MTTKKDVKKEGTKIPKEKKATAKATLVSFSISAVIPTQQYGNIQPRIEVTAATIEDARDVVLPFIEDLYQRYAETPLSGKAPKFLGKVEVTEKVVGKEVSTASEAGVVSSTPVPEKKIETPAEPVKVEKPEPVLKAEKAISLATTHDALGVIENQIKNSVKIPDEFKAGLLDVCKVKRESIK